MKKNLLSIFCCAAVIGSAQILNPSFEAVSGGKPLNWNTSLYNYNTYFIKDTSAAHTGNHAALIKGFSGQPYTVQGAVLGLFSISGKPLTVSGWYKCNLMPGDSLALQPYAYQGNTSSSTNYYCYNVTTSNTSVYKQITASFTYPPISPTTYDTLFVDFYLSGTAVDGGGIHIPSTGSWAIIDDISMTTATVTGINENGENGIIEKVYPQPSGNLTYLIYTINNNANCSLEITDITGKKMLTVFENEKQSFGRYKAEIATESLSQGIYFAKLSVNDRLIVYKIIKS
ncbi:MAG: T9SS type A sorting domain-containing protein [Bacteroidetes bacterium]|nr:T9SS type A sorting domain-containing protein [Bacteroidota bacterium]